MASWRYGRGKSIALTTDLEGRWSRNWIQWSGLQSFWGHLLDWLNPPEENLIPAHDIRVSYSENRTVLDLSIYDEASANSHYRFAINGNPTKAQGYLTKLAPGHYQAVLPISQQGDYRIDLAEERGGRRIPFPAVGYTLAYDLNSEIPRSEFNNRLLSRIAEATGGEINPQSVRAQTQTTITETYVPIKQPFIILAFCLFLFEVVLRKFAFSEPD